jgi:hypothetical protein
MGWTFALTLAMSYVLWAMYGASTSHAVEGARSVRVRVRACACVCVHCERLKASP